MNYLKSKSTVRIGIAAAVVILIVLVVAVVNRQSTNAPVRTAAITITDTGFQPAQMIIKKNTVVTWTNTDTTGHTVGANPYPTHDSLKALASKALIKGEKYSFTFDKAGTYNYHDDLHPLLNASITVVK
jgi:plastocyanin